MKPGGQLRTHRGCQALPVLRAAGTVQARATAPSRADAPSGAGAARCGRAPGPPSPAAGTSAPPARTRAVRTEEAFPGRPRCRGPARRGAGVMPASGSRPAGSPAACPGAALHLFILVEKAGSSILEQKIFQEVCTY